MAAPKLRLTAAISKPATSAGDARPGQRPARLSVVVPYRDRAEHLARFLPHMAEYFRGDPNAAGIAYRITVVEQPPGKPFNAGRLRNIGFLLTEAACDYVCFHDVDYLPIEADYRPPDRPMRIVWRGADRVRIDPDAAKFVKHRYESFFGAVVMFPAADFRRVNGYSNEFWGWGFQDSDLRERCLAEGLEIGFRDGTFETQPHRNRGFTATGGRTEDHDRNRAQYERRRALARTERLHRADGLGNIAYEIRERVGIADAGGNPFPGVERVLVDF